MYQYVLFDLDGTLTDPGEGITNSVAYALEKFGIINTDRSELYPFIGPPLLDSFMEFFGMNEEDGRKAVLYYREFFRETGILQNKVYEGIPFVLESLKKSGKKVILATSKPEPFANRILEHFDLIRYFDFVAGATFDGVRGKKSDVIKYALESMGIADVTQAIMVGDREYDILGARENCLASVGVLFGYGSREELTKAGADFLAETPMELLSIIK